MHGLDVEEVITVNSFDHIVVGQIVGIKPHPNADKLRIAEVVIDGDKSSSARQEIVCGAPNIEVGQKVPVALVGAKLPNGITIEPRAIRGVTSNGMLCAADELGLGKDHSGIMVLEKSLKVGTPFGAAIGANEEVIDLAIPANRADLMAMRGLAWEIGAMLGQAAKLPSVKLSESKVPAEKSVTLNIADSKLCSLLTARVIRGVTLKPAPTWMVNRLRAAGMRSVNIIADITNYVMLEYGQPLHAYDLALVHGATLIARPARPEDHIITLDSKMRQLTTDTLVIADSDRVIGIAGVMGGKDTEVTDRTTDVILEAAMFNPISIRKTSRRLGLISEASKRFEKGLWPSLPEQASAAAAAMIVELCGGSIEQGIVHVGSATKAPRTVTINPAYISERLGTKVSVIKSKTTLTKLGFNVKGATKAWKVTVPEWRIDVTLPEDIVDEVGRMIGYEELPQLMPTVDGVNKELPPAIRFKEEVKNILVDMGYSEVMSHAFYGEDNARIIKGRHFEMANPLDVTQHKLRKSLLPQIDDILKKQADAGQDAEIFEIGLVFDPERSGSVEQRQVWKLAMGITKKGEVGLNSTIKEFLQKLAIADVPVRGSMVEGLVRGRSIEYCEFDLLALMSDSKATFGAWDPEQHIVHDVHYREQSKFPAITRDIAFWWSKDEAVIHDIISALGIDLLHEFTIKDRFAKDGQTSFNLSFIYQSPERTLTKAEVDKEEQKIKDALVKLGAVIR